MKGLTQFARATAFKRITVVNRERERLLADPGEDPVHDFRVSLRRLEPVLDLFAFDPLGFAVHEIRKQCEEWLRSAGKVRDCDIVPRLLPAETHPAIAELREQRAADLVSLVSEHPLQGAARNDGSPDWAEPEVAMFAAITLPHLAHSYFRAGAHAVAKKRSLRRLHEFRLHGKTLRYSLELFQPLYGSKLRTLQTLLKQMQTLLGEMADARAALKLARQIDATVPEESMDLLKRLASDRRDEFIRQWQSAVPDEDTAEGANARYWIDYLRRYAHKRARG